MCNLRRNLSTIHMIRNNELICPVHWKHDVRVSNGTGQYEVVERRQKMRKLLLIAVVVVGTSALVLAGRAGGFGRQGYANGPGWMHPGPGGRGQFGPMFNWQDDTTPPLMLGLLDCLRGSLSEYISSRPLIKELL